MYATKLYGKQIFHGIVKIKIICGKMLKCGKDTYFEIKLQCTILTENTRLKQNADWLDKSNLQLIMSLVCFLYC